MNKRNPIKSSPSTLALALFALAIAAMLGWASTIAPAFAMQSKPQEHKVVFQVDSNDVTAMKHAISGSINAAQYYKSKHEGISIEIVANATGIEMFRDDTSPLKDAIAALRTMVPGITLSMCGSSKAIAEQKEGHPLPLIEGVTVVPYGVGRLIDLEEHGWAYIHA
ncbi:DsrE family protein [Rhizobium sp. LEGMi198b]